MQVCRTDTGHPPLPALALVVSGGHTELLLVEAADAGPDGRHAFTRLGGTRDDAAGEAFDKVARLLDLPYPGGPPISALAATATARRARLPRAWLRGTDDFSFSGLKTAVAQMLSSPDAPPPAEVAWAFEEAVCDVLARKAARTAEREGVRSLLLAGGVAANRRLRERVAQESPVPVHIPPPALCTDNGAMIAAAAFHHLDEAVSPEDDLDIFSTAVRRARVSA
jgi:N6-L-threonylcarbamoyladenine synthase